MISFSESCFSHCAHLLFFRTQLWSNGGWSHDLSMAVLDRALFHVDNTYKIAHLRYARAVGSEIARAIIAYPHSMAILPIIVPFFIQMLSKVMVQYLFLNKNAKRVCSTTLFVTFIVLSLPFAYPHIVTRIVALCHLHILFLYSYCCSLLPSSHPYFATPICCHLTHSVPDLLPSLLITERAAACAAPICRPTRRFAVSADRRA